MNEIEFRLRGLWNQAEQIVGELIDNGYTNEARALSRIAADIRAMQSALTAAHEEVKT